MGTVEMEPYWMVDDDGNPFPVLGIYNGRSWDTIGHGKRQLNLDIFLSEEAARRGPVPLPSDPEDASLHREHGMSEARADAIALRSREGGYAATPIHCTCGGWYVQIGDIPLTPERTP